MEPVTEVTAEVKADEALVLVQAQPIEKLFDRATIDPILEKIEAFCLLVPQDISTELGRKAVASLAYKITKTKTFIEAQRVSLVASEKKRLSVIDQEGKRIRDTLDSLRDAVRKPLTDWEDADKARIARHEETLLRLANTELDLANRATIDVEERIKYLAAFDSWTLEEFHDRGEAIRLNSLAVMQRKLEECKKADADREELERLRKEREAREKEEYEERIAAKAREDAERRANEAEARAKRAEQDKVEAQQKAIADAQAAVRREREQAERQRKMEEAEAAKREADRKHRGTIHSAMLEAFEENGIPAKTAKTVVELIAKRKIPHLTVNY